MKIDKVKKQFSIPLFSPSYPKTRHHGGYNGQMGWKGPAALDIQSCALAPLHKLPVLEVIEGTHILSNLTLPYGEVVHDYLEER